MNQALFMTPEKIIIPVWGLTGSGKSWFIHSLPRALEVYYHLHSPDRFRINDKKSVSDNNLKNIKATNKPEEKEYLLEMTRAGKNQQEVIKNYTLFILDAAGEQWEKTFGKSAYRNPAAAKLGAAELAVALLDHTRLSKGDLPSADREGLISRSEYIKK